MISHLARRARFEGEFLGPSAIVDAIARLLVVAIDMSEPSDTTLRAKTFEIFAMTVEHRKVALRQVH